MEAACPPDLRRRGRFVSPDKSPLPLRREALHSTRLHERPLTPLPTCSDRCLARHLVGRVHAQNPRDAARCTELPEALEQFGTKQVEIAQQDSIPVLVVQPGSNDVGIGLINCLALQWIL